MKRSLGGWIGENPLTSPFLLAIISSSSTICTFDIYKNKGKMLCIPKAQSSLAPLIEDISQRVKII